MANRSGAGAIAILLVFLALLSVGNGQVLLAQVRGEQDAIAAAGRLLEHAGGEQAWKLPVMEVVERGYLANGDVVELRIIRDFQARRRLLERRSASGLLIEWVSAERAWVHRDGKRVMMPDAERHSEYQGLHQETYSIYYRFANRDSDLRVEVRERGTRLLVFDRGERVLCWFRLDAAGRPIGWGNFYDGSINEHYYGPLARLGDVTLPRWGVSTNGAFRFEYVSARLSTQPLAEPLLRN